MTIIDPVTRAIDLIKINSTDLASKLEILNENRDLNNHEKLIAVFKELGDNMDDNES